MFKRRPVERVIAATALVGCSSPSPTTVGNTAEPSIEDRLKKLEAAKGWRSSVDGTASVAYLKSSEQSYTLAQADFGNVAVVLDDVQSYANGSKVVMRFGNTTSAHVSGLKAKVEWGSTDKHGVQVGIAISKTESFTDTCLPPPGIDKRDLARSANQQIGLRASVEYRERDHQAV